MVITTGNAPPVADAGDDRTAVVNTLVTLDGTGSSDINGDPLTYSWSFVQRPQGSNATLSSSTAVMPTFTPDLPGLYRLRLDRQRRQGQQPAGRGADHHPGATQ